LLVINALVRNQGGSAPVGREDLALDLRTNEYAIDLNVSLGQLGDRSVEILIGGESSLPVDITDRFSQGRAALSQEQIDDLAGGPLSDGDHRFEVLLDGNDSGVDFVLTVDRSAPELTLVTPIQAGQHSDTARIIGSISDANRGGPVTVALNDQTAQALVVDESGQLDQRIASELAPGSYQLTVAATDAVGNTSSRQVGFTVSDQFVIGTDGTEGWAVRGSNTVRLEERDSFVVETEMPIDVGAEGNRTLSFDVLPQPGRFSMCSGVSCFVQYPR